MNWTHKVCLLALTVHPCILAPAVVNSSSKNTKQEELNEEQTFKHIQEGLRAS